MIDLQSKNSALEDTMQIAKKAYAKDNFTTEEYLKMIRDLSKKQFKCVYKCQKLANLGQAPQQR